jgi:hypothetical protein
MFHLSFHLNFGAYLKDGNASGSERFSRWASHFSEGILLYFEGKWCGSVGKDPLSGRVDGFQICPKF